MSTRMATFPSVAAEEQHEQLRRFVDEWASDRGSLLESFSPDNAPPHLDIGQLSSDPIALQTTPLESVSVQGLIHTATDNTPFAKLLTVMGFLCTEIEHIRAHALMHIFPALIAFGEPPGDEETPQEGDLQVLLAQKVPLLLEASQLSQHLRKLLQNLVLQLGALYPPPEPPKKAPPAQQVFASFRNIQLDTALEGLGAGFSVLATLDEIIAWNGTIAHAFTMFKRMLETVRSDPGHFGFEGPKVGQLDTALEDLKGGVGILAGGALQDCFVADFYSSGDMQSVRSKAGPLLDKIGRHVKDTVADVSGRIGGPNERPDERERLLGALCNYLLCLWLGDGKAPDKKLGRAVWELHKRVPLLPLMSNISVQLNAFLMAHLPPGFAKGGLGQLVKEPLKEAAIGRSDFLARSDENLGRETVGLLRAAAMWLVRMDSAAGLQGPIHTLLLGRLRLLVQGLKLATGVKTLLRTSVDLHMLLEVPITKEQIGHLGRLAGLLKAIEGMYFRRGAENALAIGHMLRTCQEKVRKILEPLRDAVEEDLSVLIARSNGLAAKLRTFARGPSDEDVKLADALAAAGFALRLLEGPPSVQRRILLRLSLDVLRSNLAGRLAPELTTELDDLLMLQALGADLDQQIRDTCDCSFLHWSRKALLPIALRVAFQPPSRPHQIPDLVSAFVDGLRLLKRGCAGDDVIAAVEAELAETVTQDVITPLCQAIETDLRLHNHSHSLTGAVTLNPTKTGIRDLSSFLSMQPIRLGSVTIVVRERLEAYLNAAFHDHTAVALHNWKTYSDMRQLAQDKYGLRLDDILLPARTLEHGQDVLFLVRHIHTLAQQYTYDLNGQVFFERPAAAHRRKYLNAVTVRTVSNGMMTHGLGIVTTAVNCVYQFFAKRLVALSQALFDDDIKSRMVKERKFYREMMERKASVNRGVASGDLPLEYPVTRAQKLIKDIRKLRKTESEPSPLDVLRGLVSEIGNALGFVRMVANGASQYCSDASQFTPPKFFTPTSVRSSNTAPPEHSISGAEHSVSAPEEHSVSNRPAQSESKLGESDVSSRPENVASTSAEHSVSEPLPNSVLEPLRDSVLSERETSTTGREGETDTWKFETATLAAGAKTPTVVNAARGLDETLRVLSERGGKDSSHYLRMLASIFARELQTDQNLHLRTFFLLSPALLVASTEAMLAAKEQLAKKGARERRGTGPQPLFTDDGFALGLAYLLEVLGQGKAFDSLGWSRAAQAHFASEKATCDSAYSTLVTIGSGMQGLHAWSKRVGGTSEAEAHNLELVQKRLELFMREFELQGLNFESARMFFA